MSTRFPRTASKYNVQLIDFTPLHQQALDYVNQAESKDDKPLSTECKPMHRYGFIETDDANKLGVSPTASYGYDGAFDAPEPPSGGAGNWVSLYFPHTEWDNQWGDNFTQDIVLEDDEFFEHNLTVWTVEVLSNMSGQTSVTFDFLGTPLGVPMYVEVIEGDGDTESEYSPITDGSSVDFFLSQGNVTPNKRSTCHILHIL